MSLPEDPDKQNSFLISRRAREVSQVLADAARVARFSSRARSAALGTSYVPRRGDRALHFIKLAALILILIIPSSIAVLYFGLLASDQFVSEAKLTVASGAIPKMDGIGSVTGLPSMAIFQDSQIIINYIESRALVDRLDREIHIRKKYGSDAIDWWSRFNKTKPIEKLVDYWQDYVKASMTAPAGIIKLEVRAFTPRDAREIADAVVQKCEELVNGLNDKMRRDTISVAESELRKSGERLKNIRVRLETLRNEQGVIDTSETSSSFTKLLVDLEGELLKAKNDYETGKKYVNDTAPQLKVLKAKMDTLTSQIAEVKSKVTTNNNLFPNMDSKATGESVLSSKMRQFSEIELQQKIAEASYTQSSAALEMARQMSEKKMIYLHQITEPTLPEEAKYPSRKLYIALFLAASTIAYLIINRLANFVRDHFA